MFERSHDLRLPLSRGNEFLVLLNLAHPDGSRATDESAVEMAAALQPDDQAVLYNLSGAYALTRQYDRARQTVERLLALVPNHQDARKLLSLVGELPAEVEPDRRALAEQVVHRPGFALVGAMILSITFVPAAAN